uniref:Uncharacterized protein n=1 Tax=viral metagenome TaxID=1070528 RepID=A0A6C0HZ29_9ZZZZ
MSRINFEQMEQERKDKIDMTMIRDGPKIFMIVSWSVNSNMIRWFISLKEAVEKGKKLKEEDYRYENYDITILLDDGTATRLSEEEIDVLLVTEANKIDKTISGFK